MGLAPANTGRNAAIAQDADAIAAAAADETRDLLRSGDRRAAQAAWERCTAARRAARMLRGGPDRVREVLRTSAAA